MDSHNWLTGFKKYPNWWSHTRQVNKDSHYKQKASEQSVHWKSEVFKKYELDALQTSHYCKEEQTMHWLIEHAIHWSATEVAVGFMK